MLDKLNQNLWSQMICIIIIIIIILHKLPSDSNT